MEAKNKKLRKLIIDWAKEKSKTNINTENIKNTSENNDIKFISVECDNDNGMTLYDHLYNGY